ncbi:DUF4062 domain-containing protein [Zymomonas mobilis]|uniref:DUF4062 domain-containing protein n=1 Tax=Zymomonas mobilis TaxID=542 RepID=UPI0003C73B45|nr:DUF4062 domain-containing protein [Zymomonas mobilis]AHB10534.1 protein of unknown function (DUF4062) [Zymomonas mobilis subsp. mobilis str. CP4 = NRRL B-14023]AHJ70840.1 hypothetical protein A254_01229 [Zymomonas mobilis subsp. mobilis NRRL B-12526]AHJ72694.1 hypothetical protein A265_01230 [Zymomonas mobilis subsp. mobilis str. CP4 = NRRL B-14023]TWE24958.1 uncharacterized protein DUF4062 [Zymomonas mobilis]
MARPRVFVSSTYYDLKYIRASLEGFIESLGFEAILFERGNIPFHSDTPLDKSCYHEAENADIFVLIVGGRYGSSTSDSRQEDNQPFERYQSITQQEFDTAQERGIPTFILVDNAVRSEHYTYLQNKNNEDIKYAHVDDVAVFHFLDKILEKEQNNPVHNFEKVTDIESWLREQWAGLFRDLLRSKSQQQQLSDLQSQILELKSVNETLKNYLEAVLKTVNSEKSDQIIKLEEEKIKNEKINSLFNKNKLVFFIKNTTNLDDKEIKKIIESPKNFYDTIETIDEISKDNLNNELKELIHNNIVQEDYNKARYILGKYPIDFRSDNKNLKS